MEYEHSAVICIVARQKMYVAYVHIHRSHFRAVGRGAKHGGAIRTPQKYFGLLIALMCPPVGLSGVPKDYTQKAPFSTELERYAQGITLVPGKAGFGCFAWKSQQIGRILHPGHSGRRSGIRDVA